MSKSQRIFLIGGPPGCGKGTLIQGLFGKGNDAHIVPMSGLLNEATAHHLYGPIIEKCMDDGSLVPTEIICEIFRDYCDKLQFIEQDLVLDGVIRTRMQAKEIIKSIKETIPVSQIKEMISIEIKVPLEVCKERMLGRGRSDDKDSVIENRFDYYKAFTQDAINSLSWVTGCRSITINGLQSPEQVLEEAKRILG